ncbi:ATP-binding protein [candidate division WOR-3 bacterium]|nr:ATP-binding protein [candidate division WOR-3 bacterium]
MKPIALTIGTDGEHIFARGDKFAEKSSEIQILDFVKVKNTIGRIVRLHDAHDFNTENAVSRIAKNCLKNGTKPEPRIQEMVYKKLEIEPLGTVYPSGELTEYEGGIGYFEPVYHAKEEEIAKLYPSPNPGLTIGHIASGYKVTNVPFKLGLDTALSRHLVVFGKNGTGKTNFLKEIISANLELEIPVPMLVFGHPDLGIDNPNDKGTKGLSSLNSDKITLFGYDKRILISSEEISLSDIFDQFETSTSMRDLWAYMKAREPRKFIQILARYDLNADPYRLRRKTIPDPQKKKKTITMGIASMPTIDAVSKQARILANYVDADAPPLIGQILLELKRGKTVLVNTFNMSEYYQGLFVKLLLSRLQRSGKHALHRNVGQRYFVVIDEAQHFIKTTGEKIAEFVMECRKFGVTLLLSTQSPASVPSSVYGQIYSTVAFHLNRPDLKVLVENAPLLEDCKTIILRPPLRRTLGLAIVQALGYPYPAVIKVPKFERRFEKPSV